MIQAIELFVLNHLPMAVLEFPVYDGWTIYDILERYFAKEE